jgi:endonuclease VIII
MEGPSLVILKEELEKFRGKEVVAADGSSKIPYERLSGKKIKAFHTWGKHFLIVFKNYSIRIHFLMFGSYRINETKENVPRLHLKFADGDEINFYTTAVRILEGHPDDHYDWTEDVMSDLWDPRMARRKLKRLPQLNVGDALLDQHIFSGVGNIIKNEVLFRIKVHPNSVIGGLPPKKLTSLVSEARKYSFDFYEWKKIYQLKKHWLIFTRKKCPRCQLAVVREYTGKTRRRSFFCSGCQVLYDPAQ